MPSEGSPAAQWIWIVLPFLLTLCCNAAEAAAVYFEDATLHARADDGDRKALALESLLLHHEQVELCVRLLGCLCLLLSTAGWLPLLSRWVALEEQTLWLRAGWALIWAMLFFSCAILAPRRIAGYRAEQLAYGLFGILSLCCRLLTPFAWLAARIAGLWVRIFGHDPAAALHSVTEQEIRMLIDEGEERGAIEEAEKQMINNIFEFDDRDVSEVMTHRTELSAVPIDATLEEVSRVATETGYSRIPVYEQDLDRICGILYAKDLLRYLHSPEQFSLREQMRPAIFVPESSSCSDVFALLQHKKLQLAVVVDEYGGTYGVVTMEDLLETIVGSIQDEYDNEQEPATLEGEGKYLLDGSMGISEAEQLLEFHLPDDSEADTLGGFLTELLDGVPQEDDLRVVCYGDWEFTVTEADEKRIRSVRAQSLLPSPVEDAED